MPLPSSASCNTFGLAQYPHVPHWYIVARQLSDEQIESVNNALRITPIVCAIVTDNSDTAYAQRFSRNVLYSVDAESTAEDIYTTEPSINRSVIIGEAGILTGVYSAGRREDIPC